MKKTSHFGFLAVRKRKGNRTTSFAFGDREFVSQSVDVWGGAEKRSEDKSESTPDQSPDFTHESALTDALSEAVDFGLSQYQLIVVCNAAPSLFSAATAHGQVIEPTIKGAEIVEDKEHGTIYGLNKDQFFDLVKRKDTLNQLKSGAGALPSAAMLTIVATFDTLIVDTLSKMLRLGDDWLKKSERTLSIGRLTEAANLEELVEEAIAEELYQFSRGSHDEQARYIETNFGVAIKKQWRRWPDYIEVFERRNLVAHGIKTFSKRYVSICKASGHKGSDKVLGKQVELTPVYLAQALDVLLEFAILLPFSLWRKSVKDKEDQAFSNLNEAAFKLISHNQFIAAERVLGFALSLEKTNISDETKRMLVVNRASALKHLERGDQAEEALSQVDWSASSDVFKICVASVKGDAAEVARLLPIVKGASSLEPREFKEWPCFAFVRDSEDVKSAFEAAFGEPLSIGAIDETVPAKAALATPSIAPPEDQAPVTKH